jgi:hypothetical protein
MRLPGDVEELHLIAEYHTARRTLRRMGWGSIVFGIINTGIGMTFAFHLHPVNAVLALIGLLLLAYLFSASRDGSTTCESATPAGAPTAFQVDASVIQCYSAAKAPRRFRVGGLHVAVEAGHANVPSTLPGSSFSRCPPLFCFARMFSKPAMASAPSFPW